MQFEQFMKGKFQLEIIGDLLLIKDMLSGSALCKIRLGFYFSKFSDGKNKVGIKNAFGKKEYMKEKWLEIYGEKYRATKANSLMHIGARYNFDRIIPKEYIGLGSKNLEVFWGLTYTSDGTGKFWPKKIKEWNCGYLTQSQRQEVMQSFVRSCRKVEYEQMDCDYVRITQADTNESTRHKGVPSRWIAPIFSPISYRAIIYYQETCARKITTKNPHNYSSRSRLLSYQDAKINSEFEK